MSSWVLAAVLLPALCGTSLDGARAAYREARYFELVRKYPLDGSDAESSFFNGFVEIGLGKLERGEARLRRARAGLSSELRKECYEHLVVANARLGRYADAGRWAKAALADSTLKLDKLERANFRNHLQVWGPLQRVGPMRGPAGRDSKFKSFGDRFCDVAFEANGRRFHLAADTGANLSLVREGLARQMGLQMIKASFEVGSISGDKVRPWLGVADELNFGGAKVRNAVFLVMRDKDLYFPQVKFQLDGVIGLPVLMALGSTEFNKSGLLRIGSTVGDGSRPNLFVAGLKLLVEGVCQDQALTFALDTGADATMLYPPFFRRFRAEIDARGFPRTHRVMGVAGARATDAYMMTDVVMEFAGHKVSWDSVDVLTQKREADSDRLFGNLGRDMFTSYKAMSFDWRTMQMTLR